MAKLGANEVKRIYAEGLAKLKARSFFEARALFARIVQDHPRAAEAWYQMGEIDRQIGRPFSAAQCFEHALNARPDQPEIMVAFEGVSRKVGRADHAAKLNRRLAQIQPKDANHLARLGASLQQAGEFDEADRVFKRAIKKFPQSGTLYRFWFRSRKIKFASDPYLRQALDLWKHDHLPPQERMSLGFALSKAMEDIDRPDRVFTYLKAANDIGRGLYPFDREDYLAQAERYFEAGKARAIARDGPSDFEPIFIIGTPRSGTTLTERIISAHPDVKAGGEIAQAYFFHSVLMQKAGKMIPVDAIPPETLESFARQYELSAREIAQAEGARVTDKSILNNFIIGWLAEAFPRARFIVVRRDPHDVALSIYKNAFTAGTHVYSHDLKAIATVLDTFDRTIAHWKERVEMAEVNYDALTADPETESRKLVAAAGLDWHDDCLEFYKQKSAVATLSVAQVRQPIYKSSSGGWRRYEAELKPFTDAWEQRK